MDDRPTVVFADDNHKVTEIACTLLSPAYEVVKSGGRRRRSDKVDSRAKA